MSIIRCLSLLLFAVGFIAFGGHAQAKGPPSANPPAQYTFCPKGAAVRDGCGQAPQPGLTANSGTIWHHDCFASNGWLNGVSGNTTNYSGQLQNYNVVFCDYPGGVTTDSPRLDPALSANAIPGCTYNPTGSTSGGPFLNCAGPLFKGVIDGYEFGPTGGHGCTTVKVSGVLPGVPVVNGVQHVVVSRTNWKNDGACGTLGSLFTTATAATWTTDLISDTIDGNARTFRDNSGVCTGGVTCNAVAAVNLGAGASSGPINVFYTNFDDFAQVPFPFVLTAGSDFHFNFSMGDGYCAANPLAHCEFFKPNPANGAGALDLSYSNLISFTSQNQAGLSPFPTIFTPGAVTLSRVNVDHVLVMPSFPGGVTGNATISSASIAAGGSTITVAGLSAGTSVGSGQLLGSSGFCGAIAGELAIPLSGQVSAGIGGGYNSGSTFPQSWGVDLDLSSYTATGGIVGPTLSVTGAGIIQPDVNATVKAAGSSITGLITTAGAMTVSSDTTITLGIGSTVTGNMSGGGSFTGTITVGSGTTGSYTVSPLPTTQVNAQTLTATNPITAGTSISTIVSGSGGTGSYTVNHTQTAGSQLLVVSVPNTFAGHWKASTTQTCTNLAMTPKIFSYAGANLSINANSYGSVSIKDNFIDTTSTAGGPIWGQSGSFTGAGCSVPTVFARNVDAAALVANPNSWQVTIAGTGC